MIAAAGWLALSLVLMSAVEYAAHRWPMHSRRFVRRWRVGKDALESHAALHHGRYFREAFDREADPAARYVSLDLHPGFLLWASSPLWGGLCLLSVTGGLTLAAVFAAHGVVWTAAHREMHFPRGAWFARTRLYRYWRAYHRRHHERPGANFNVLLPGMDWLCGTYGGLSGE